MPYKVETIDKKDSLAQSEASKSSIKDLFNDLLDETKGFKYQITLKILLKKNKRHWNWIFTRLFQFNNKNSDKSKIDLDKSFQEILYRIDNWISEGSGWIVESVKSQYINISTFRPLIGTSYITLPAELTNPKKGQSTWKTTIKNYFLGVILGILIQ